MKQAEKFLQDNYNGFFDEFDDQQLQDIIQAMEDYHKSEKTVNLQFKEMILTPITPGKKVESPGHYKLVGYDHSALKINSSDVIIEFDKDIIGEGKEPKISTTRAENVVLRGNGCHVFKTRMKLEQYSCNFHISGFNFHNTKNAAIAIKSYDHVDGERPEGYYPDKIVIEDCTAFNIEGEFIYIGEQKPTHKYIKVVVVRRCKGIVCGREIFQFANVESLLIEDCEALSAGRRNEPGQEKGIQISNCNGLMKNTPVINCLKEAIAIWSFGMTFMESTVEQCETAFFFGRVKHPNRFPDTHLDKGDNYVIGYTFKDCDYIVNCRTEEMNIYFMDCVFPEDQEIFHPDSYTDNVYFNNKK